MPTLESVLILQYDSRVLFSVYGGLKVLRPQIAKGNILFILLAAGTLLISGLVSASLNLSAQQDAQAPRPKIAVGATILNDTKGVDFSSYMRAMHDSIMRNLAAKLPESVTNGEKGLVVVRVRIQKDGSLSDDAVTLATSSGKRDMDAATLSAIRAAAPFRPLPEGYLGPNLDLKFVFYYGIPPKPPQKSTPAPAG
jgi:TonB family protein